MPVLTVIAGPNGSGKSTFTRGVDLEGRDRLLDPDAVARMLNPADPFAAAIAAGREVLNRIEDYLAQRVSFAIEPTLSSRNNVALMSRAKSLGYRVDLVFIALEDPERCISRVRERAAAGGHHVPDTDVRRRYMRSLTNAGEALRLADRATLFDNSSAGHCLVLSAEAGNIVWRAESLPAWVERILSRIQPPSR